jgi:hypothetical protein
MDRKWIGAKFALAIGIAAIPTMPMQTIAAEDNSADWPVEAANAGSDKSQVFVAKCCWCNRFSCKALARRWRRRESRAQKGGCCAVDPSVPDWT